MLLIRKWTATQRQWVPYKAAWGTEVERLCVFGSEIRRFLTLKLTEISPNGTTGSLTPPAGNSSPRRKPEFREQFTTIIS